MKRLILLLIIGLAMPLGYAEEETGDLAGLKEMSSEDLLNIEVTSVFKKPGKLFAAPAAVTVITSEEIRRSGATTLAELFRMVPGMHVARSDANKWSIASRAFSDQFTDKLLVLIDGRRVYSPVVSGVIWQAQHTPMEDIDRIEIIKGPAGTVWGGNAANGAINIVTKNASETEGGYILGGFGNEEKAFGRIRYGFEVKDVSLRFYGLGFNRDSQPVDNTTAEGNDEWYLGQGGFRADWAQENDTFKLHGDYYSGVTGTRNLLSTFTPPDFSALVDGDVDIDGANAVFRWDHSFDDGHDLNLQLYFDHFRRLDENTTRFQLDTYDLEFQHRFQGPFSQEITSGFGYRYSQFNAVTFNPDFFQFLNDDKDVQIFSLFLQDEITLAEELLTLTVGSKYQRHRFVGGEWQPNARLALTPNPNQTGWLAVSRGVRAPDLADTNRNFLLGPNSIVQGAPVFRELVANGTAQSEILLAYELGYRWKVSEALNFDLSAFYNIYDKLATTDITGPAAQRANPILHFVVPSIRANSGKGEAYGFEISGNWQARDWWRITAWYSSQRDSIEVPDPAVNIISINEGTFPRQQVWMRHSIDLPANLEFDVMTRFVGRVITTQTDSYITFDARLAWKPTSNLELSLVGQNLVDARRKEINIDDFVFTEVTQQQRSFYLQFSYQF